MSASGSAVGSSVGNRQHLCLICLSNQVARLHSERRRMTKPKKSQLAKASKIVNLVSPAWSTNVASRLRGLSNQLHNRNANAAFPFA